MFKSVSLLGERLGGGFNLRPGRPQGFMWGGKFLRMRSVSVCRVERRSRMWGVSPGGRGADRWSGKRKTVMVVEDGG